MKHTLHLFIDTSNADEIIVGVNDYFYRTQSRADKSQKLLPFIIERLSEKGKSLHDITSIEVNTGPGSFTGLRIGVAVANTLGWVLGVSVNDKDVTRSGPIEPTY